MKPKLREVKTRLERASAVLYEVARDSPSLPRWKIWVAIADKQYRSTDRAHRTAKEYLSLFTTIEKSTYGSLPPCSKLVVSLCILLAAAIAESEGD